MIKRLLPGLAVAFALVGAAPFAAAADEDRPYSEGPVVDISYIKIAPGKFDAYMKYLDTTWKQIQEEEKKAGLILDYAVYQANPRTPAEPDLVLMVRYRNMAALDGLEDREMPIMRRIWSSRENASKAEIDRGAMRQELGGEIMRELVLK